MNSDIFDLIKSCFQQESIYYSAHAKREMHTEPLGRITDSEVFEAIMTGEVIEEYPNDLPYPSLLIFGETIKNRPLHIVCAFDKNEKIVIIVTVYEPSPDLWIEHRRRRT